MPLNLNLLLGRIHCLRPSLPFNRNRNCCTPLAASKLSPTQNPQFTLQYLVQSCGLSFSYDITHLKSPDNPDAVLRFLRETGRAAVSPHPLHSFEQLIETKFCKAARPRLSSIIARKPSLLTINLVEKLDFWLGVLGSVDNLSLLLFTYGTLLRTNLENVVMPNLYFLQHQCGTREADMHSKMEYLIEEAARIDRIHVVQYPSMLMHRLQNRLIPRNVVRNLLRSKGLPAAKRSFSSVVKLTEQQFLEQFIRPYEHIIPDLHRAYVDAGKIRGDH